jgi:hypothetical protein
MKLVAVANGSHLHSPMLDSICKIPEVRRVYLTTEFANLIGEYFIVAVGRAIAFVQTRHWLFLAPPLSAHELEIDVAIFDSPDEVDCSVILPVCHNRGLRHPVPILAAAPFFAFSYEIEERGEVLSMKFQRRAIRKLCTKELMHELPVFSEKVLLREGEFFIIQGVSPLERMTDERENKRIEEPPAHLRSVGIIMQQSGAIDIVNIHWILYRCASMVQPINPVFDRRAPRLWDIQVDERPRLTGDVSRHCCSIL